MYFSKFPSFLYDFKYKNSTLKSSVVTDITENVRFKKEVLSNVTMYDLYNIVDGETPEIIAEKFYGNPNYHWIVMLANEKHDYINDFPVSQAVLPELIKTKYNPVLTSSEWYISNNRIYYRIDNQQDAFNIDFMTYPVVATISGKTTDGNFTRIDNWGDADSGFDYNSQYFWFEINSDNSQEAGGAIPTGDPIGSLTITTVGRENNPVYYVDSNGFRVSPDQDGASPVTGVDYENALNESKRTIKIISPQLVSVILAQFNSLI